MKRLIYKKTVDNEIAFSTESQLITYVGNNGEGILFAVRDDNLVLSVSWYDHKWILSNVNRRFFVMFDVLVAEFDLYYIGNDQVNHMLETYE